MNQENERPKEEQEIDLLPVLHWISNGIKGFFKAIGSFFLAIGHAIILFLIFLKRNIILMAVFCLVGLALGYYLDTDVKTNYMAKMRVSPNFNSTSQLLANIEYYDALTEEEDYQTLAKELDISLDQAKEITSLTIEPSYNDTELLKEYDELARLTDTMALENLNFESFKNSKRRIDYENYNIFAVAKSRGVIEQIVPKIIQIKENESIKARRLASIETIDFNIASKKYQLQELDSLIVAYQKMIGNTATATGGQTNLYLAKTESTNQIENLFKQKQALLYDLELLRDAKYSSENVVNTVSSYVVKGTIVNNYTLLKVVLLFLALGIIVAFLPILFKFLNSYTANN